MMSIEPAPLSTSSQDGLLAHVSVGCPASQGTRRSYNVEDDDDDNESLILCSLAKSRPACRRRGYDSSATSHPPAAVRALSVITKCSVDAPSIDEGDITEDHLEKGTGIHDDENNNDETETDESPILFAQQTQHVPYDEITESFRHDINQMMKYDSLVNSLAAEKLSSSAGRLASMRQKSTATGLPGGNKIAGSTTAAAKQSDILSALDTSSPFQFRSSSGRGASLSQVSAKDMEKLREYVRMDRGLPLTKEERATRRRRIEFRKEPAIRPKMNRATAIRVQYVRKCSLATSSTKTGSALSLDASASMRLRHEEMASRLRRLVSQYKSTVDQPLYKYNRGFEMRYLSNKGNPLMPSSFRDSYEAYNKPLFAVPRKLELPKRFLWPGDARGKISYLGFRLEGDLVPAQYQQKPTVKQKRTRRMARPPVRKAQRVPRTKPDDHKTKTPWNYGVFERAMRRVAHNGPTS